MINNYTQLLNLCIHGLGIPENKIGIESKTLPDLGVLFEEENVNRAEIKIMVHVINKGQGIDLMFISEPIDKFEFREWFTSERLFLTQSEMKDYFKDNIDNFKYCEK
ncbi:MAG: hypothetical protein ABIJ40_03490 [Bacteroidota bacterium]